MIKSLHTRTSWFFWFHLTPLFLRVYTISDLAFIIAHCLTEMKRLQSSSPACMSQQPLMLWLQSNLKAISLQQRWNSIITDQKKSFLLSYVCFSICQRDSFAPGRRLMKASSKRSIQSPSTGDRIAKEKRQTLTVFKQPEVCLGNLDIAHAGATVLLIAYVLQKAEMMSCCGTHLAIH